MRGTPEYAGADTVTVPDPTRDADPDNVIHEPVLTIVHEHRSDEAVTTNDAVPPARGRTSALLLRVYVHAAAACETTRGFPATVMTPVRPVGVVLAATV